MRYGHTTCDVSYRFCGSRVLVRGPVLGHLGDISETWLTFSPFWGGVELVVRSTITVLVEKVSERGRLNVAKPL